MFRSLSRSISFKTEHKGCSVVIRTQKVFLKRGFEGVRGCSGCSGCPGGKTKLRKPGFYNKKLKKGVQMKTEHIGCSDILLEV